MTSIADDHDNFPALAARHTVHAFDMPGHGFTTATRQPRHYDLELMPDAIRDYLDSQQYGRSASSAIPSGRLGAVFRATLPERVEKLVLLAPRPVSSGARCRLALTQAGLHRLQAPTLIVWGQADQYLPVQRLAHFKQAMPQAQTHVLERCGHALHEECAQRVNALMMDFLARAP